jgi:hypothetical protein
MFRNISILLLSVVWCARSFAGAEKNPQLTVFVYNYAGVPERVLNQAERITEKIYMSARVGISWKDCTRPVEEGEGQDKCSRSDPAVFSLRIVHRSLNLQEEDFGIAFLGSDGMGQQADVFYLSIERLEQNSSLGAPAILGHVMAHELGHLLLGSRSHSNLGIMQARWTSSQLRGISMGQLTFDRRQSEVIRARLHGPYAALRSKDNEGIDPAR